MFLVISTSLNPDSRSRLLAKAAAGELEKAERPYQWIDLREVELPLCDGAACYAHPEVQRLAQLVDEADGIVFASPIYNYDINAAGKNLIELTGKAWTEKVVGMMCAAGGQGSYMSMMGVINSLMLDFRTLVLPRFVYATGDAFQGEEIADSDLQQRVEELVNKVVKVSAACKRQE